MFPVSYTLSDELRELLQKIEVLRRRIGLRPLQPKLELKLRWEATVNRIHFSLALAKTPLGRKGISKILASLQSRAPIQEQVLNYKKTQDYIYQEWYASPKNVRSKTILTLNDLLSSGDLNVNESSLQQFLDYIQTGQENPVIKAAIAQIQILYLSAFTKDNDLIARFLALLVLYKYGYDFRGLLILEEYFARTAEEFEERITNALSNQRITYWLEYFAKGILVQLQKAEETLDSFSSRLDLPTSFWEINERQKLVLAYLDDPNSTVTNKKIQQLFKISQITASRDLAKLTSLGLLFSHGKGRSIYYTKV